MSVFEQCLPYRELGFDKDLTCDVLEDDEDILTQISAQLDIPSISAPGCHPGTSLLPPLEGLESGMLDDMVMEDLNTYSSYTDSGISSDSSIKSEPCSPSSSSQDQSPPLSPVQGLSFVNSVNNINNVGTFLSQPVAPINAISLPATGSSLSGKVAIPKLARPVMSAPAPLVSSVTSANVTSAGAPPPLVLVCNQTPSSGPIFVKTEPVQSTGFCNPLVTGGPTVSGHTNAEELRNLKRQQRMIKNRESACISRKKKKEYVTQLEDQIKMLSSENTLLRNENENLKEKLRELQTEKSMWTDSLMRNSNGKKATAVLALLFMVSLNMNSLTEIYNSGDPDISPSLKTNAHMREPGRSLLWVDEDTLEAAEADNFLTNITDPGQCGGSGLNQTESIRMESDLRGWFNVEPSVVKRRPDVTRRPTRSPKKKSRTYPVGNVVRTPMHSLTGSVYHMLTQDPGPSNALNLYSNIPRNTFASFFEAIERRDDTFYVVSFSGDHLLVPATNNNKTSQPRMSLMLPAVVSNNSSDSNQSDTVAMMKIDCQVINTQMVHIMKDAIPDHLAANKGNNKTGEGEDNDYDTDKVFSASYKRNASRRADNRTFNTQSYDDKSKSNPKIDRKRKQFGSN